VSVSKIGLCNRTILLYIYLVASQPQRLQTSFSNAGVSRSLVAILTALCDRLFYGMWTFPPLRFVHFNIAQSLAIFYGSNRLDYYLTEGMPLLLMSMVPFALVGLFQSAASSFRRAFKPAQTSLKDVVPSMLTWTSAFMIATLSLISHKEARFLYPLLPLLHLFVASPLAHFARRPKSWRSLLVLGLFSINIAIAMYTSRVHQRGVVDVMDFLRSEHESKTGSGNTTVAFLMPCHSTPWRSHLIHSNIDAWALTCEPPIDVPFEQRDTYEDEADIFYNRPFVWLKQNMENLVMVNSMDDKSNKWDGQERNIDGRVTGKRRSWPQHLVFFQQLEPQMKVYLKSAPYRECWRGFNTDWHDDWRRQGDVVVWCMT
jgi:phosphatidylinositol glycan class B